LGSLVSIIIIWPYGCLLDFKRSVSPIADE
jgi:hypothetical protein